MMRISRSTPDYKDDENLFECKFCEHPRYKSSTNHGKQRQVSNK